MIIAVVINSVMLFAFIVCLLFTIGDIDKVANTPTGLPLIEVFYQANKSKNATNFLVVMPAIVLFFTQFNVLASVSRLIYTFAKDNGFPFSPQLAYVSRISPIQAGKLAKSNTNLLSRFTLLYGSL
jgi:choline transport protein